MLKIKMYPAKNGDSFLVDSGGTFILIDAGFASTFQDFGPSEPRRSVIYGAAWVRARLQSVAAGG